MQKTIVEIDGKPTPIFFEMIDGKLWVHVNGETWDFDTKKTKKSASRLKQGLTKGGEVRAPMPGKILKVMVKAGDTVAPHQVVAAMEAMKMEYTLRSTVDGKVKEVRCREGQQVPLDELLIEIEETK